MISLTVQELGPTVSTEIQTNKQTDKQSLKQTLLKNNAHSLRYVARVIKITYKTWRNKNSFDCSFIKHHIPNTQYAEKQQM